MSEEEVWCEEAVAHLDECCPGFDPGAYLCQGPQYPTGCESSSLRVPQAKAIARSSCQELVAAGKCENPTLPRVQEGLP
jgi:purine nucleoside phosphorylase